MKLLYRLNLYNLSQNLIRFVFILLFQPVFSQIHVKKQKSFELDVGVVDDVKMNGNQFYQLKLNQYHSKQLFTSFGGFYQTKNHEIKWFKTIVVEQIGFTSNIGISTPLNRVRGLWLNTSIGIFLGYEWINRGNNIVDGNLMITNKSKAMVGVNLNPEIEAFLSPRSSLCLDVCFRWNPLSTVQSVHFQNGIGLKYHFF